MREKKPENKSITSNRSSKSKKKIKKKWLAIWKEAQAFKNH